MKNQAKCCKDNIPKCLEIKTWKRDAEEFPIFHVDGKCIRCNTTHYLPPNEWYSFKYQILGYCKDCVDITMGAYTEKDIMLKQPKKVIFNLKPDMAIIYEIEAIEKPPDLRTLEVLGKISKL